jgi:integrase
MCYGAGMRTVKFEPKEIPGRKLPWCVNIPAGVSPSGKRERRFYATERLARGAIADLKELRKYFGDLFDQIDQHNLSEAVRAIELLRPHNVGLLEAVRAHIATLEAQKKSVPFRRAFDFFFESKKNKSHDYRKEIEHAKARFEPLLEKPVCDIQPSDLEPILDKLPSSSRNATMRRLRTLFNIAKKRSWMAGNESPISKLDFADTRKIEVEVFSVDEARKLLEHSLDHDLEFLPYRVLTFFCGIRPEGEMKRLEWSDIRIPEKTVVLRAEATKTKRKRFVDLSDNAIAWLNEYRARGGTTTGLIAPWTPQIGRRKHRTSYRAVGIRKWIQQGARHSYCSYWLALHKDADKLVLQSGHDDASTMWTRYHQGVTPSDAEKFWNIVP